jgi:hypothetical protein
LVWLEPDFTLPDKILARQAYPTGPVFIFSYLLFYFSPAIADSAAAVCSAFNGMNNAFEVTASFSVTKKSIKAATSGFFADSLAT